MVPVAVMCRAGYFCTAASAYPCPKGTWNNLTGQVDSSKCNSCPEPERMTTLAEGASSVDQCVCIASYYMAADGSGCRECPVGTDCSMGGVSLGSLKIRAGYFRLSANATDVRRCPDAAAGCSGALFNVWPLVCVLVHILVIE